MKKRIVILAVVAVGLILFLFVLRWSMSGSLFKKGKTPESGIDATAVDYALIRNAKDLVKEGKKPQAIKILEELISAKANPSQACKALFLLADIYKSDRNLLKAKESYLTITRDYPAYCDYGDIQKRLTELNMEILFSPIQTKESEIYIVKPGDSIVGIAERYSMTIDLIKKSNGLKSDTIMPGMKLKVLKTPFSIIVDKSQSTLTLLLGNEVIKTHVVSTGKNNSTPTGAFKIKNKLINPPWYSPKGAVIPAGDAANALGSRWIGFNIARPDYGIHGTNDPKSIGYQCTEGCIRMHNADAEELYSIVPLGTEVTVID